MIAPRFQVTDYLISSDGRRVKALTRQPHGIGMALFLMARAVGKYSWLR